MPKISDLLAQRSAEDRPFISFEYFPPRTDQGVQNLLARVDRMKAQNPLYVDFTWGAGGSTADLTFTLAAEAHKRGLVANMHLTCTNMDAALIKKALDDCQAAGICNICALRGDPPADKKEWEATEGGFECALDLIRYIRKEYGDYFCLSCAGYPEGHPNRIKRVDAGRVLSEAEEGRKVTVMEDGKNATYVCSDEDFAIELDYLKQKVDAGAQFIMTQMFFDTAVYRSFVAACRGAGIEVPIVPGLMCIQAKRGFERMTGFCRSRVPAELSAAVSSAADDDAVKNIGVTHGATTCNSLREMGAPGFHFYTLNLEKVTTGILKEIGEYVEPPAAAAAAAAAEDDASIFKGTTMGGTTNVTH